jgi:hypothetical protein
MAKAELVARLRALHAWLAPAVMAAADPEQGTRIIQQALHDALACLVQPEEDGSLHR